MDTLAEMQLDIQLDPDRNAPVVRGRLRFCLASPPQTLHSAGHGTEAGQDGRVLGRISQRPADCCSSLHTRRIWMRPGQASVNVRPIRKSFN